jgi:hypothetical protein
MTARSEGWCYLTTIGFVSQFAHFLTGLVQNFDFRSALNQSKQNYKLHADIGTV